MESRKKNPAYPLMEQCPELVRPMSGKAIHEINMENVLNGELTMEDGRISKETLLMQAKIAEDAGYRQVGRNLTRAAELVAIADTLVLEAYNALRPYRAEKQEILQFAKEFEEEHGAADTADFLREAAQILEQKHMLKGDRDE